MLTRQQAKLLIFLKNYQTEKGVSPSYDEMREGLGIKSKSGIHVLIRALIERGFLKKLDKKARALEILKDPSFPLANFSSSSGLVAAESSCAPVSHTIQLEASDKEDRAAGLVEVPFFGAVPSVVPLSQFLQPSGVIEVGQASIRGFTQEKKPYYLAVKVSGDYLKEVGILDGDTLIFEECHEWRFEEVGLFTVHQQDIYLKKAVRQGEKIQLSGASKYMIPLVLDQEVVSPKAFLVGLLRQY